MRRLHARGEAHALARQQTIIVIVAAAAPQLLVIAANARADRVQLAKIERRPGDGMRRPRQRNRGRIGRQEMIGNEADAMIEDLPLRARAVEIEEAVIGEIDDRRPVRRRFERQREFGRAQ